MSFSKYIPFEGPQRTDFLDPAKYLGRADFIVTIKSAIPSKKLAIPSKKDALPFQKDTIRKISSGFLEPESSGCPQRVCPSPAPQFKLSERWTNRPRHVPLNFIFTKMWRSPWHLVKFRVQCTVPLSIPSFLAAQLPAHLYNPWWIQSSG